MTDALRSRAAGGLAQGRLPLSFELFPPRCTAAAAQLEAALERLTALGPDFFSVTYGAGGSTQGRSVALVARLCSRGEVPVAAHLTCIGASRSAVDETARRFVDFGASHIVALRGDLPPGATRFAPPPDGYASSAALVAGLKRIADIEVSVGAYCERHPESPDWAAELEGLRRKVDAGADRAITQFFFDNDLYDAYRDRVAAAGIDIPVVPGILPVHSLAGVRKFADRCGASVPWWLASRFAGVDDAEVAADIAADLAAAQIADLAVRGAPGLHFYTLNRAGLVESALVRAGLAPTARAETRAA